MSAWHQTAALVRSRFILFRRRRVTTAAELLAPALVVAMLGALDLSVRAPPPSARPAAFETLGSVGCHVFDDDKGRYGYGLPIPSAWCVPVVFAPATPDVVAVMTTLAERNGYGAPRAFWGWVGR